MPVDLNSHLQDCIVRLSITDDEFLRLTRPIVKFEYLSNLASESVKICHLFWDTFKEAPKSHFHDELVRLVEKRDAESIQLFLEYIKRIHSLDEPNVGYVISRVNVFVKRKELESGAIRFAELVSQDKIAEAQTFMYKTLAIGVAQVDRGLEYTGSVIPRRVMSDDVPFLMPTGISALDHIIKGYSRKQVILFLGSAKGMKTWGQQHTSRVAVMHGLNVAHISHEMTEEELELRYDEMFGAFAWDEKNTIITYNVWDAEEKKLKTITRERPAVSDIDAVISLRKTLKRFGGKLFIKKFPMYSATMDDVEQYLNYLEMEGINIDVLVNDYADIMAPTNPKAELRHQIDETYKRMKRLADERNILVVTASQTTRDAIGRERITRRDSAEDVRKIANADIILGIAQSPEHEKAGIAILCVVGGRTCKQGGAVIITPVLDMGQFAVSSVNFNDVHANTTE